MSAGIKANSDGSAAIQVGGSDAITITSGLAVSINGGAVYPLTSGTAVASTSGTSIDFTGIPSTTKRITVMFNGVSTNGTSSYQVQLGVSGVPETSGYAGNISETATSTANSNAYAGAGFVVTRATAAAAVTSGMLTLINISSNTWIGSSLLAAPSPVISYYGAGNKTLAGVLNLVRITTVNGTDTFDAGSINILYE